MTTYPHLIRQGDVPLTLDKSGVVRGKRVAKTTRLVIARGETSGHEHTIVGDVELYELDKPETVPGYSGVMSTHMVLVGGDAKFAHLAGDMPTKEHGEIDLKPGLYWQLAQWEYTPEEIHRSAD